MAIKAANKSCSEMKKEIPLLKEEYNRNKELVENVEDDEKRAFNMSQLSMSVSFCSSLFLPRYQCLQAYMR